jgi:O-antigen ligase
VSAEPSRLLRPSIAEQVLAYGPFAILLFGPLAFGAVSPLPIFILEAGSAFLFSLWMVRQVQSRELSIAWNPAFAPMLAFLVIVTTQLATRQTTYRYATYSEGMLYIAYGLLCFLVVQTLRHISHLRILATAISAYGFAIALFALFQSVSANGKLYWLITPRDGGWIYGPYVNHNHYAGLMEMLIPVPLVLAFTNFVGRSTKRLAIISAALMSASLFLSESRGGIIAFLVEIAIFAIFIAKRKSRFRATWTDVLFPLLILALLVWLGGSQLTQRLASIRAETKVEISGGVRMNILHDGLRMFRTKPLLGYGLGTFPEVYPQFRSFSGEFWINAAHNDYLQLLVETGILSFVVMLWFLWVVYSNAAKKLTNWAGDFNGTLTVIALLGCTGILIHSSVDFNLHIPANAALFYVICTLAAMEPRFPLRFHRKHRL